MGAPRFRSLHATPPGGMYEYAIGDDVVRSRSKSQISAMANELRVKHGLATSHDPFIFVMAYMCPKMQDGFCDQPSAAKTIRAADVKRVTAPLLRLPCATSDIINNRLFKCVNCPSHKTKGFCMDCTGILQWIYREYGTRRPILAVDHVTGVCECETALVAVIASVADRPLVEGAGYPAGCWRTAKEV